MSRHSSHPSLTISSSSPEEQQQLGPPPTYPSLTKQQEDPPAYSSQNSLKNPPYHWLRLLAWVSYAVVAILLTVALVPGSWGPNTEDWKPTRGLEIFSFEINLDGTPKNSTYNYVSLEQIVITLSSTCVTPETTIHGGGTCFSNLTPSTWSVHTIPQYNGSARSTSYFNLPFDAPEISTRVVFVLLLLPLIISFLIVVALMLGLGCSGRITHKDGRMRTQVLFRRWLGWCGKVWPYVVLGILGFIFILAGAILLRVQVSRTVSALRVASKDERYRNILYTYYKPVEEDSKKFWGVLWASVALMAVNPIMLALDGALSMTSSNHSF